MYALNRTKYQADCKQPLLVTSERCTPASAGAKGYNLALLEKSGCRVPPWFALTPLAFWQALPPQAAELLSRAKTSQQIEEALSHLAIGKDLEQEIKTQIKMRLGGETLLAVRSSAPDEDGAVNSFAGQLESRLNVRSTDLLEAIKCVWLSAYSARNLEYRRWRGLEGAPQAPAVIIQSMVRAQFSGVAFSCNPVSGTRELAVVSATNGLAQALVNGSVNGETFLVGKNGNVLRQDDPAWTATSQASGVSERQLVAIARCARRLQRVFQTEQDLEWAIAGGKLYILQTRPVTVLSPVRKEGETVFDNSNIGESYQGPTTPLTFSFAKAAYENVYLQFCRLMGVPRQHIQENAQIFPNMIGFVHGRIYYNLLNWYRLLSILPGFKTNRKFMEQMMGLKEPLAAELVAEIAGASGTSSPRDRFQLCLSMAKCTRRLLSLRRQRTQFNRNFEQALGDLPDDLTALNLRELTAAYRQLESKLLTKWDAPLTNDFFAMIFYGILKQLCKQWCHDQDGSLQNALLCDLKGVISVVPAQMLETLAQIAGSDETLLETLETVSGKGTSLDEGVLELPEIKRNPAFAALLHQFMREFGCRCANELKLESHTLDDDWTGTLRQIAAQARTPQVTMVRKKSAYEEALAQVKEKLGTASYKSAALFAVMHTARELIKERENLRFQRTRLFGAVRRIFRQIGARLAENGLLTSEDDIYFLEVSEIFSCIEGTATTRDLKALVAIRRSEYSENLERPAPPTRFTTTAAALSDLDLPPKKASSDCGGSNSESRGIGCSPGIVRGRIRILTEPNPPRPLQADSIVVAQRTDPGWISVFAQARGLIVEHGSVLSHSAIVSRELGVPAIVAVANIMHWVKDGDWVEMDGKTGIVRKLNAQDQSDT